MYESRVGKRCDSILRGFNATDDAGELLAPGWYPDRQLQVLEGNRYAKYGNAECDECGGTVRLDDREDKVCTECGLVHGSDKLLLDERSAHNGRYNTTREGE